VSASDPSQSDPGKPTISTIVVSGQTGATIRHLVLGYLRAYARVEQALEQAAPVHHPLEAESRAWEALFEALNWADSIDQFLKYGQAERGADPTWLDNADEKTQGVALAMQCVRNAVHHQWWEALSMRIDMDEDGQHNSWIWFDLPANVSNKKGKKAYKTHLRGQPVIEALRVLRDAFWKQRGWRITAEDLEQPACPFPSNMPFVFDTR
jgi:hypothetical protein